MTEVPPGALGGTALYNGPGYNARGLYINIIIIIRRYRTVYYYNIIVTSYGLYKHDLILSFPFPSLPFHMYYLLRH